MNIKAMYVYQLLTASLNNYRLETYYIYKSRD